MRKPSAPILTFAGLMFLLLLTGPRATTSYGGEKPAAPQAQGASLDWQKEFDDVCSKTQDSMTFTVDELRTLVKRCDALEPQLQKLDETRKAVYLRRLQQCRGLYAYVLESKKNDQK